MLCEIAASPITNRLLVAAVESLNQSDVFQCQLHYFFLLVLISLLYLIQNCLLTSFLQNKNEEPITISITDYTCISPPRRSSSRMK